MNARRVIAGAFVPALLAFGSAHAAVAGARAQATPTPYPAATGQPLPYPAYGTPVPDAVKRRPQPGVAPHISLDQAFAIAISKSPVFASQISQYDVTHAKYGAERSALLPNVSLTATGSQVYTPAGTVQSTNGTFTSNGIFKSDSISVQLQQLIFDGGRTLAALRSAKEANTAGYATLERDVQSLQFTVAQSYFQDLQAQAATQLAAQVVRQNEAQEDLVRARIRTGQAAPSDLYSAQFATAQSRSRLVQAQGQEIAANASFDNVLGLEADADVLPNDDVQTRTASQLPATVPLSYDEALKRAFLLRPDYLAAVHNVESADANVRFAKLARFPLITASARDGKQSTRPNGSGLQQSDSLGATLSIPLFDQGLTNFNVASAASQRDQALDTLQSTRIGVELNVRQGLAALISARSSLDQTNFEVKNAQVAADAAQARYKAGVDTLLDLLTAQVNLTQAQTDQLNALYALRIAEQTYAFDIGQTSTKL